jgi:hypothetical protein
MIDPEPLKRDPNSRRKPETAVLRNYEARSGSCTLVCRVRAAHGRPSGAGIRGIPAQIGSPLRSEVIMWRERPTTDGSMRPAGSPNEELDPSTPITEAAC